MAVKVKICGVRTPAVIEAAAEAGADFVGLVLFPKSPRHVEVEEARVLAAIAKGKLGTVAVLVDPDDALIDEVVERVRPDLLQLHGSETPERVAAIKARTGLPVMKAIAVADAADVAKANAYAGVADYLLFDAKAPAERHASRRQRRRLRLARSAEREGAVRAFRRPDARHRRRSDQADRRLSGRCLLGRRARPGEKDIALVRRFIQAAKSAAPQARAKAS